MCSPLLSAFALFLAVQDSPAPGYAVQAAPYPTLTPLAASTTLSSGDFLLFDGQSVVQHASDGTPLRTLGVLSQSAFPSFLLVDSTETEVLFGESSTGWIFRVLVGIASNPEPIVQLPNNYDAARQGGTLYVSAATCGFNCGNELWRVDLATHVAVQVAVLPGASGPLVVDAFGGVIYATASDQYPAPLASTEIRRFSPSVLTGATLATLNDASLVGGGFDGAARLALDRRTRSLYLLENDFASGLNRIRRVQGGAAQSPILLEGPPFRSLGNLSFHSGPLAQRFLPFQPETGGTLHYTSTDFANPPERAALTPARPAADLTVAVSGTVDLDLSLGPPAGFARILFAPRSAVLALESTLFVNGIPMHLALERQQLAWLPGLFPLDTNGALHLRLPDPAGLASQWTLQLWLYDAARRPVGTSDVAML
jgi:hypothetical protein